MHKLLEKIQLARVEGTIAKFFEKMADLDLLIIDDYGMKILDGQQLLDFMELIEDRHGRKSTIISSQLPVGSWYDVLAKNATIADAILDRMVNTSHIFELKGESMKKNISLLHQAVPLTQVGGYRRNARVVFTEIVRIKTVVL